MTSSSQASYPSLPPGGESSLIPLLVPIPSVPLGHLPLIRGVGLSKSDPLSLGSDLV